MSNKSVSALPSLRGRGVQLDRGQFHSYNELLLDYGMHVLNQSKPDGRSSSHMSTISTTNICVSPLQVVRTWALLSLVAVGKTATAARKFLQNIIGVMPNNESVHDVLLCLNAPIAECSMPVCIRLFAEHQPKSVFVETGFSGDDDGLASIARINAEVDDSTGGRITCVFRDNNGPNRRAQMVLVSAVDCTFYWSFQGKRKPLIKCPFYDSPNRDISTMRYVDAWPCEGKFRYSVNDGKQLLELDSHLEGFKLYFYTYNEANLTATSFLQAVDSLPASKSRLKIYMPRSSVLCSVRLSECTNKNHRFGFRRIFDREKSDLSGIFYRSHSFYPYFVTLWEHYHLAQFTIVPEPPTSSATSKNKDSVNSKLKMATQKTTPHKNHTGAPADPLDNSYVKFDIPFFFMIVKQGAFGRIVHCIGRFCNIETTPAPTDIRGPSIV